MHTHNQTNKPVSAPIHVRWQDVDKGASNDCNPRQGKGQKAEEEGGAGWTWCKEALVQLRTDACAETKEAHHNAHHL